MDSSGHRMLESELENHRAQLSRFQLQVNSVTEDIVSMESGLNSTIMTLKKALVSELSSSGSKSRFITSGLSPSFCFHPVFRYVFKAFMHLFESFTLSDFFVLMYIIAGLCE